MLDVVYETYLQVDVALREGNLQLAQQLRERILGEPTSSTTLTICARVAFAEGDIASALAFIGEALRLEPFYEPAYRFRLQMSFSIGDLERVWEDLRALQLFYPLTDEYMSLTADIAMHSKHLQEGTDRLDRAMRVNRESGFFANLSGLLRQAGKHYEEAEAFYRRALDLSPGNANILNNLATVLHALDRFHEAQVVLEQAIASDPGLAMAWYNLANVLKDCRKFAEAEASYRKAIELRNDYADARLNLGCILIQQGRWEEGWQQYESRWMVPGLLPPIALNVPRWQGQELHGKQIIVLAEQGIGDTIQFSRYLPTLIERGAQVTFLVPQEILAILSRLHSDIRVVTNLRNVAQADYYAPLMSIPQFIAATEETIPPAPYLEVDPDRQKYFFAKLGRRRGKIRVGIVWGGNTGQMDDHHRSIPLDQLGALFALRNVRWIGLQKGDHRTELALHHVPIEDWSDELESFDDTAALMSTLDGVVTVCSSPLHLAGAVGVRTLGLLNAAADWRWRVHESDTPWYGSVRLLRQKALNVWDPPVAAAAEIISNWKPIVAARPRSGQQELKKPAPSFRTKTRYGVMDVFHYDTYITNALALLGEYCQDEINLLGRYLSAGDTVVEAGGNVGAHTLPLAQLLGKSGRLHTFEPQSEAYRLLERNVRRNGLTQVTVHEAALGENEGTTALYIWDYRKINNFGNVGIDCASDTTEHVKVQTIDGLDLASCALLKIDVEGSEIRVLNGALKTIERCRPYIYVEDDIRNNSRVDWLLNHGYRCYRHRALLGHNSFQPHFGESRPFGEWSLSIFAVPQELPQPEDMIELFRVAEV